MELKSTRMRRFLKEERAKDDKELIQHFVEEKQMGESINIKKRQ